MSLNFKEDMSMVGYFWKGTIQIPMVLMLMSIVFVICLITGFQEYSIQNIYFHLIKLTILFLIPSSFIFIGLNISNKKCQRCFSRLAAYSAFIFYLLLASSAMYIRGTCIYY